MDKTSHHSALPLISIVVPVYKVEPYLAPCIRSILRQTYRNFELILIDDGSPDECGAICDDFASRDSRIRVIHQDNGGVSCARNRGIDSAQGEWITFIDSDDLVTPNYLSSFHLRECTEYDIIMQGLRCFADGKLLSKKDQFEDIKAQLSDCLTKKMTDIRCPFCKLFRKDIIKEHNIRFPVGMTYGEDSVFYYSYLLHVKYVRTYKTIRYLYRKGREDSATSIKHNPVSMWSYLNSSVTLLRQLYESNGKKCPYPIDEDANLLASIILNIFRSDLKGRKKLLGDIKRSDTFTAIRQLRLTYKEKIFFYIVDLSPSVSNIFLILFTLYRRLKFSS